MKTERAPTKPDYQRLTMLVNRIAVGMASNNGDPILTETRIISESIAPTIGWAEGERIPRATIAIDAKGGEYFAYVRGDGRGQIEIEWPNGTTTTLKFWPPESYLGSINPSGDGGVTPIVSAAEAAAKEAASRDAASHPAVFLTSESSPARGKGTSETTDEPKSSAAVPIVLTLVVAAIGYDFSKAGGNGWVRVAMDSAAVVTFLLGVAILVRFGLVRKALNFFAALATVVVLYFGWHLIFRVLTNSPYTPSLLFLACLLASYKVMRLETPPADENE